MRSLTCRLPCVSQPGTSDADLGFENSAFESLERDFQQVLTELVGDKSLERFRQEYEKLHRALKKSHESEKRLIKKCRELNSEIVSNAAKVQTALKLSQEDQNTIASLKREIEKAWKMVDASHEKEARAKDTISQLKTEISNLSRLVEQGAGLSVGQENTVNELMREKEELAAERDAQACATPPPLAVLHPSASAHLHCCGASTHTTRAHTPSPWHSHVLVRRTMRTHTISACICAHTHTCAHMRTHAHTHAHTCAHMRTRTALLRLLA